MTKAKERRSFGGFTGAMVGDLGWGRVSVFG
jgi:hypothetical protein